MCIATQSVFEDEDSLDLSISIRDGKENNDDSTSSGERSWKSPDGKELCSVVYGRRSGLQGPSTESYRLVCGVDERVPLFGSAVRRVDCGHQRLSTDADR